MSEMAETSQLAIGPYISMAKAALALNSSTAAFREALLVKVPSGSAGGEGGDGGAKGGEGGEGGGGGGEGNLEVKQTLKPPLTAIPSDDQLSAEASTPSGPSVPE